jgi:signal transduction histidine kinase
MNSPAAPIDPITLDASADLQTVLAAWHAATLRLEQTHEALRGEVQRLTHELEDKNRELARKNRLADIGQMASHVAHEVRNSLVPVTLYVSLLRRRVGNDAASREIVDKIAAGFTNLETTVSDLLNFTADRDPAWKLFEPRALIEETISQIAPQTAAQDIRVAIEAPVKTAVGDRDMLRRALLNLTLNAVDAMRDGGDLTVSARTADRTLEIAVTDTGPGLSEQAQHRAFEPFFTTKSNGTGLGLAIVERIVEAHGGEITAENRPHRGAQFTLRIPQQSRETS